MTRRRAASAAALAAATVALFVVSHGRWSDPLIDSGREWIVPDGLARGELLYRDVAYWFGPFTPYFQAAFFRLFGSSFASLVVEGCVSAALTLAVLYVVLRRVTDRRSAALWTALAIPALVFMPNAGGELLSMGYRTWHAAAFALAAVAFATARRGARARRFSLAAGACAGLSGLCRAEWGVAALAATVVALLLRSRGRARGSGESAAAAFACLAVFGGGIAVFVSAAGAKAVLEGPVLLIGLPAETRHSLAVLSGRLDWGGGLAELLYSSAAWTGLFLVAVLVSRPEPGDRRRSAAGFAATAVVLLLAAAFGGAGGATIFSAAPLAGAAALIGGLRLGRGPRAAAVAAAGLLALVLSYRRPFHIGDAAYVGPPLLFAFVSAAGLLRFGTLRRRGRAPRKRLDGILRWSLAAVVGLAFVGRAWQFSSMEERPIAGTAGMLSARPELASEIERLAASIRASTADGDSLVVFPEGELLNFLTARHNPLRHRLYIPGYVTDENEPEILRELERADPAAIVLWRRPAGEFDRALFGDDYGARIRAWIEANYAAHAPFDGGHARFRLFLRRKPAALR